MPPKNEGEVILREHYGSSGKERICVKPPDQNSIVLLNVGSKWKEWNFRKLLMKLFLPEGYPHTVSKDYLSYQKWDTAQAFCSTITGILATQEVLRGVGVGDQHATPLAATVTWVLRDGCGHVGRIMFAYTHGKYLDAYSKKWRMYADIANDAAMCIEMALPSFRSYSLLALCASTLLKAVVGVAGGASRVALTQHHAVAGNLADVAAKDAAQETAVNLLGSLVALALLSCFGSSLLIFVALTCAHVACNYLAVRAVCVRALNAPRLLLVLDGYLREERVRTPCHANSAEPIVFYHVGNCLLDMKLCGFKIKVGSSIQSAFSGLETAHELQCVRDTYRERAYVLNARTSARTTHVLLKDHANTDDVLCGYFHAVLLSIVTCAINNEPLAVYSRQLDRPFARVCAALQAADWPRVEARGGRLPYQPSPDLLVFLNRIVANEWPRVRDGLKKTGWDLSKHLIVVDQWRLRRSKYEYVSEKTDPGSEPCAFGREGFRSYLQAAQ